jgi:hypothetical protein
MIPSVINSNDQPFLHQRWCDSLTLQVAVTMTNEKSVSCVLSSVARNLLKADITWGKIVSVFCVAGGLAVDCVRQVSS